MSSVDAAPASNDAAARSNASPATRCTNWTRPTSAAVNAPNAGVTFLPPPPPPQQHSHPPRAATTSAALPFRVDASSSSSSSSSSTTNDALETPPTRTPLPRGGASTGATTPNASDIATYAHRDLNPSDFIISRALSSHARWKSACRSDVNGSLRPGVGPPGASNAAACLRRNAARTPRASEDGIASPSAGAEKTTTRTPRASSLRKCMTTSFSDQRSSAIGAPSSPSASSPSPSPSPSPGGRISCACASMANMSPAKCIAAGSDGWLTYTDASASSSSSSSSPPADPAASSSSSAGRFTIAFSVGSPKSGRYARA